MSNTPKTDAACGWPVGHHGRIESRDLVMDIAGPFVHSSVARELERENKQLRQTVLETLNQRGQRELIVAWDRAKELERENSALRKNFMAAESEIILLREEREELRAMLEQKEKHP